MRDFVAGGLLRAGLHPNVLTVLGMFLTVGAGVAIATGSHHWPWDCFSPPAPATCWMGRWPSRAGSRRRSAASWIPSATV